MEWSGEDTGRRHKLTSGPVVQACMRALASVSNCRVRCQPCALANSLAFLTMPVPFSAAGVTTTLAPSIRMIRRRSTENGSAMQMTTW